MLSVDASGVVPVGVRPPPPLRGSSPCEAGQFWHPHGKQNGHYGRRMENRRGVTSRTKFIKSPPNFDCPYIYHKKTALNIDDKRKGQFPNIAPATRGL